MDNYSDRAGCVGVVARPLGADDTRRLQAKAIAIEGQRLLEVVDGDGDDVDMRPHPNLYWRVALIVCPTTVVNGVDGAAGRQRGWGAARAAMANRS